MSKPQCFCEPHVILRTAENLVPVFHVPGSEWGMYFEVPEGTNPGRCGHTRVCTRVPLEGTWYACMYRKTPILERFALLTRRAHARTHARTNVCPWRARIFSFSRAQEAKAAIVEKNAEIAKSLELARREKESFVRGLEAAKAETLRFRELAGSRSDMDDNFKVRQNFCFFQKAA